MKDRLLWILVGASLLIGFALVGVFAMYEFTDTFATPSPTPTKTPWPTATQAPTPTLTPTPDVWQLTSFPTQEQTMGLLAERYSSVEILGLALEPDTSLFIIFATSDGELLVAEIRVIDGWWTVLRVYPVEDTPPPQRGRDT